MLQDTEFAIPIKEIVKETRDLHGGLCAKSVLKGSYSGLTSVFAKLRDWVKYIFDRLSQNGKVGAFKYSTAGAHLLSTFIMNSRDRWTLINECIMSAVIE